MVSTSDKFQTLESWQHVLAPYNMGYRIKLLSQLLYRKLSERLEPYGLTPFHWVVLCCLWEDDGLPTCSIGEKLQQVGGTLTGVLDRMEERCLIRRERDTRDRRIWRIWLTDAGKELAQVLPPIIVDMREETWRGVSPSERKQFSQILDRAIANLS
ncbi:MarR family winged helix-turn-helix transcriptional regulator [Iningainema tapete]|uniref:MarR family transcriptional regulator n=1 Tax=Iningainema tapete BLCC-T55 TaxID=2748662 RepID=A0A8J6XR42_9CYAN|nr:MarR family transcriptional regulator [Iningainema tapete]MBD2775027.1 MarR family transcriptional regulator [Iningainema tapete BLCC-T55]